LLEHLEAVQETVFFAIAAARPQPDPLPHYVASFAAAFEDNGETGPGSCRADRDTMAREYATPTATLKFLHMVVQRLDPTRRDRRELDKLLEGSRRRSPQTDNESARPITPFSGQSHNATDEALHSDLAKRCGRFGLSAGCHFS
jgi:hypothetical protein